MRFQSHNDNGGIMRFRWFPWKFLLRRMAKQHGILDPVSFISQFNRFSQPSEVAVPDELLRASIILHARGLINARTIQTNMDWIWPFWVNRQFNPKDISFIPRSYSLTHVNLTNRNWTASGHLDCPFLPIVDPRGMVTPFYGGWSLDCWMKNEKGQWLIPSRLGQERDNKTACTQKLVQQGASLGVETRLSENGMEITATVHVILIGKKPYCEIQYDASSVHPGVLYIALRPVNPEGVSFIHRITSSPEKDRWIVDGKGEVIFKPGFQKHAVSTYTKGDVFHRIAEKKDALSKECKIGLATAAAGFETAPGKKLSIRVLVNLENDPANQEAKYETNCMDHYRDFSTEKRCRLQTPVEKINFLFDAAINSIILLAPCGELYAGPFYYKRFWFRDAVYILYAMLSAGLHERAGNVIDGFSKRQEHDGYYRSQKGEWDSNGQVLWIYEQYHRITQKPISQKRMDSIYKALRWIQKKRLSPHGKKLHAGLLPAGFSAEHLGHNDYYYWDNFWSIAGLQAGARMIETHGERKKALEFFHEAKSLAQAVDRSLSSCFDIRNREGIPASPYRRMDAGAIGSLVCGYPTHLFSPKDPALLATVHYIMDNCFVDGLFFQDMFHSGYNIYLSLHCAQVFLRAGDFRFFPVVESAMALASSTGQWPEAIHPHTKGGCQGDGQHIWTSSEWVLILKNMFAREEQDELILLEGIPQDWLETGQTIRMGPIHIGFGTITVKAKQDKAILVETQTNWHTPPSCIRIRISGCKETICSPDECETVEIATSGEIT